MFLDSIQTIDLVNGKSLVLYKGYTYSYSDSRRKYLRCSSRIKRGCQVRLRVLDGKVFVINSVHEHAPPKLIKTSRGYVGLKYPASEFLQVYNVIPRCTLVLLTYGNNQKKLKKKNDGFFCLIYSIT